MANKGPRAGWRGRGPGGMTTSYNPRRTNQTARAARRQSFVLVGWFVGAEPEGAYVTGVERPVWTRQPSFETLKSTRQHLAGSGSLPHT